MKKKALIIDGYSLAFRAFYGIPLLSTPTGIYTNALYGFATIMLKAIETIEPDYLLIAFDRLEPTFRHEAFEEYKGTRQKAPAELVSQFSLIDEYIEYMKIARLEKAGYEADDILGTVSHILRDQDVHSYILTGDRDAFQLINPLTTILYPGSRGMSDFQFTDPEWIKEKYDLEPEQLIDVKALMGDPSDNIPGVPGIGEKTALKLIHAYGNLQEVLENIEDVKPKRAKENLVTYREQLDLSHYLVKIVTDVPLESSPEEWLLQEPDNSKLRSFFDTYSLKSLADRLPEQEDVSLSEALEEVDFPEYEDLDFPALLKKLEQDDLDILIYKENEPDLESALVEFFFLFKNNKAVKLGPDQEMMAKLAEKLKDKEFSAWNLKGLAHLIATYPSKADDLHLQAYLLNPGQNLSIDSLFASMVLEGANRAATAGDELEELWQLHKLAKELAKGIEERDLKELYEKIELPLSEVLYQMEATGIGVRLEVLGEISKNIENEINQTQKSIFEVVGKEFNVNSPKQLSQVLFEDLGLVGLKKTKTGYSTDAESLERLIDDHEVIELIIKYRGLAKLKGTYLDGLIPLVDAQTSKLHTSFHQTVTATGRLSSSNPNMQNIPTRTPEGRLIRKAFTATKENWRLISADYSQIELRILAHLSQDEHFVDAYKQGQDIHRRTASEVFNIPFADVTPDIREKAKAVNFGIVYGISDYGLSTQLKINRKEAQGYIDRFFEEFPAIKAYQEKLIKEAKEKGFVTTIFNRRRYLPEINSRNFNLRSFGERAALNTPIQGSAADLIKIAMIRLSKAIKENSLQSRILLQVHDELVCEAPPEEEEILKELIITAMEEAIVLSVPVVVEIYSGDNWFDLK